MLPGDEALVESWVLSLHEKRDQTVALYVRELARFAAWLAPVGLTEATKRDLQRWIADMKQRGLKGNTIRSRFYTVRGFYKWAADEDEIDTDPSTGMSVKRPDEPAPDVLSPADLAALFKACEGTGFRERRDIAMLRMFAATGMRSGEILGLELGDLDLLNRIVSVKGKGGKARVARFDPLTAASLDRYKRVRAKHRYASTTALWLGERGPLQRLAPGEILVKRARLAGLGHIHPHQLRHTFADRFLQNGGREGDLQKLGGWESAAIMRRYGAARAVDRALGSYDEIDPMRGL